MKRPEIKKTVYDYIFPIEEWFEGYPNIWEDFARPGGLLSQEIEEERVCFYGPPLNPTDPTTYPLEARYPGLDYNNENHRERLSIFDWHITLFRVLADLEITHYEIDTIMTHEGTKYAREQYEKQHGITIEDKTSDDVPLWRELYRNRRSSSIQGAGVLPPFRFARTRAAAAHMRSLDWDTSDGEVEMSLMATGRTRHVDSRRFLIVGTGFWGFGEWRVPRRVTHAFRVAANGRAALDVVLHPDFYFGESRNDIWDHLEADLDLPEGEEMDAARLRAFGSSLPIGTRAVDRIRYDADGAHIANILDCERMRSATLLRGTELRSLDAGGYRERWFQANMHLERKY